MILYTSVSIPVKKSYEYVKCADTFCVFSKCFIPAGNLASLVECYTK